MVRWQDALMSECCRVIDSGEGEVIIKFLKRSGNKLRPEIFGYPDNHTICEEIEVAEEE